MNTKENNCNKREKERDNVWNKIQNALNKYFEKNEIDAYEIEAENTFIDDMLSAMKMNKHIEKHSIHKLERYFFEQEYDTDCIMHEMSINYSNMKAAVDNMECIRHIQLLIQEYNISMCSFSTGIVFWYWEYYKYATDEQIKDQKTYYDHNKLDTCTYSTKDVFVRKYYHSMKKEMLSSAFLHIEQYNNLIVDKARKYMATQKCKKIKCVLRNDRLKYGIPYGAVLCIAHVYALIFYCDFADFCTDFSSTFRKIKWNETIQSIKKRNGKYFHVSKYLREIVQYYGMNGYAGEYMETQHEKGPFYTGISFIMTIPAFSIALNGPVSTSKRIEVVTRCCAKNGVILQLNNQRKYTSAQQENCFNSSWISNFPEEHECIWFGGRYKIEIESIILIKTHKNYRNIIDALYKFDSIVCGQYIDYKHVTGADIDIISSLMDDYFDIRTNDKFDAYIKNTFHSFVHNKTQIILNLHEMNQQRVFMDHTYTSDANFRRFIGLILHSIEIQSWYTMSVANNDNNNNNLFKSIIFKLFPKLSQIVIYASYKSTHYGFNILSLITTLTDIALPPFFKRIIIKDIVDDSYGDYSGLKYAFCSLKMETFNNKHIRVHFKAKQGYNHKEDWLIISLV